MHVREARKNGTTSEARGSAREQELRDEHLRGPSTQREGVKIQAQLKVNLTNYKVSVPSIVRLKVSDELALNVMLKVKTR